MTRRNTSGSLRKSVRHPEKLCREALDVRPGLRQMQGARVAQLQVMARANMTGGAQSDRGHARCDRSLDSARAILDHQALIRFYVELARGKQKNVRMGFPRATISALKTRRLNSASNASTERHSCRRSIELDDAMHRGR